MSPRQLKPVCRWIASLARQQFQTSLCLRDGGNDTATYSGSALDETMTALAFYTSSTHQHRAVFRQLQNAHGRRKRRLDIAVMYDTSGVDSFTASDTSFRYTRSGVFNNIANGYDRVYAFNYFGGFDTATLNGSSGNDRLTSIANYSVLVTPTTLQQAIGFRTVIVNAGTGTDTATLQDSTGSDTLNAFAGLPSWSIPTVAPPAPSASTRSTPTVRSAARIVAISTHRHINSNSKGRGCRFGSDQFAFDALARPDRCWMWSRSHSGAPTRPKSRFELQWTLVPQAPYTLRSPQPTHPNAERLAWQKAGLPVLGLNQQSRLKTNGELRHHTLATPSERPRWLGVRRLVPINCERFTLGHHEQTETTPTNRNARLAVIPQP